MRRLTAIFVALSILLAPAVPSTVASIQPLKSVADGKIFCTAFSINEEKSYWLTAMHCVQDQAGGEYLPYLGESGDRVKMIAGFPDVDIAVLGAGMSAPALKLASVAPALNGNGQLGTQVYVTGYGYGFDPPTTFVGRAANIISIEARKYLLFDMHVWPGHSGSPIQMMTGEVVAVTQISAGQVAGGSTWEDLERRTRKYWQAN